MSSIIVSPFAPIGRVSWTLGNPPCLTLTAEPVIAYRKLLTYAPTAVLPGAWPAGSGDSFLRATVASEAHITRHLAETTGARIRADRAADQLHHEAQTLLASLAPRGWEHTDG